MPDAAKDQPTRPLVIEQTEQGWQIVIPGLEQSARQAAAAREAAARGLLQPKKPQQSNPGPLFAPPGDEQPDLFNRSDKK